MLYATSLTLKGKTTTVFHDCTPSDVVCNFRLQHEFPELLSDYPDKLDNINDDAAEEIAKFLLTDSTIETLSFCESKISDVGAKHLSNVFCVNSTVVELNLCDNKIGDDGAEALAEALCVNSTLSCLRTKLVMMELRLAKALCANSTLVNLHLSFNRIGDAGVEESFTCLTITLVMLEQRLWHLIPTPL